ncbi:SpoIID/LytB domain-containing protein [Anaerosacchariphilus sp. NSJ-68]|uniref:SpoIID/LytB domain-containing protein n=2 Tax=Lachnospiraceae TaxID=186803 RepID=A0A923RNT6_9FIRM|nr:MULTISPECIES: SpoIID/LytB domain-containing protein [Lachnospiraceae]MBC5659710.1 SpoIID/LytB domain-containing protein [Anaerosacchariphilus hominis]MBC5697376.1 SpoIID/LytB domain-containing protein [Roseburia difficilis]
MRWDLKWDRVRREKRSQVLEKTALLLLGCVILCIQVHGRGRGKEEELPVYQEEITKETDETEKINKREDSLEEEDMEAENAVLKEEPIRVLLKTDEFRDILHENVELEAADGEELSLLGGEEGKVLETGTIFLFSWEDGVLYLNGEPLADWPEVMTVQAGEQGIQAVSLNRNCGHPVYPGLLEIRPSEKGFYLINELPVETYLKGVVPSEMPSGYHSEALKAQAVCARTYAYKEQSAYGYPFCEAHVDDSVHYQVYGNVERTEATDRAVEETEGQVLVWQGELITAYYFSTSWGAVGNQEVWKDGDREMTPYLTVHQVKEGGETVDLSTEKAFRKFLKNREDTWEAELGWYRWELEEDNENLSVHVNQAEAIGTIQGIDVLERNPGGAAVRLRIRGKKQNLEIAGEYEIRELLGLPGAEIRKQDGTVSRCGSLLPSACFQITPLFDKKGELSGWKLQGGGYGHGVGMSQNAANAMGKQGKSFEEILEFFYAGAELTGIGGIW